MRRWFESGSMSLAAALVVLAVGATALALRAADGSAPALAEWTDAAKQAGTYRFSTRQDIGGLKSSAPQSLSFEGAIDLRNGRSRLVTSFNVIGIKTKCTYISSGENVYVSVHPSRRAQLGTSWLRGDSTAILAGSAFPFSPDRLDDDPERFFRDLEEDGSAKIRGVEATRYTGTFELRSFSASASSAPLPSTAKTGIPVELYISDDGLLRRMTMRFAETGTVKVTFTMDLYDYGKPVDIKAPAAGTAKDGTPEQITTACLPTSSPPASRPPPAT